MVRRVLEHKPPISRVAADSGVSERTVRKWLARWRAGGQSSRERAAALPRWPHIYHVHRPHNALAGQEIGLIGGEPPLLALAALRRRAEPISAGGAGATGKDCSRQRQNALDKATAELAYAGQKA